MKITVQAQSNAKLAQLWRAATDPEAIKIWNTASPDWHCPSASVDLRIGGRMVSEMAAKDGSAAFEFGATFTRIDEPVALEYELDDKRTVQLHLMQDGDSVLVKQTFDAESENDPEFQRAGWQAILDSFVRYAESL